MIYKSTREEVQAYFQNSALNQSELKLLANYSLTYYNNEKLKRESTDDSIEPNHFRQGGAVDTLLTGTKEEFHELYHVSDVSKLPSETIQKIVNFAFQNFVKELEQEISTQGVESSIEEVIKNTKISDEDLFPHIILGCNREEYFLNRKDDSRFSTVMKTGRDYFDSLVEAFGKTILPLDMYHNIKDIVTNLKNGKRTKKYFEENNFKDNPNLDIYFQKIIYFTFQGISCKAMLDILIVDKSQPNGVVFHPIDIKTMAEPAIDFPIAAKRLRYDIQAAWYRIAIMHSDFARDLTKKKREYFINNFRFLVETTSPTFRNQSLSFIMNGDMVSVGLVGKPEIKNQKGEIIKPGVLGITQLMEIYKYHTEKKDFKNEKILEDFVEDIPFGWDYSKTSIWF